MVGPVGSETGTTWAYKPFPGSIAALGIAIRMKTSAARFRAVFVALRASQEVRNGLKTP